MAQRSPRKTVTQLPGWFRIFRWSIIGAVGVGLLAGVVVGHTDAANLVANPAAIIMGAAIGYAAAALLLWGLAATIAIIKIRTGQHQFALAARGLPRHSYGVALAAIFGGIAVVFWGRLQHNPNLRLVGTAIFLVGWGMSLYLSRRIYGAPFLKPRSLSWRSFYVVYTLIMLLLLYIFVFREG